MVEYYSEALVGALKDISQVLDLVRARLAASSEARSSVDVKSSTRGVDIEVKVYLNDPALPISVAGDAAQAEYRRQFEQIEAWLMGRGKSKV